MICRSCLDVLRIVPVPCFLPIVHLRRCDILSLLGRGLAAGGCALTQSSLMASQSRRQGWMKSGMAGFVSRTWSAVVPSWVSTTRAPFSIFVKPLGLPSTISGMPSFVMMRSPVLGGFFCWPPAGCFCDCAMQLSMAGPRLDEGDNPASGNRVITES